MDERELKIVLRARDEASDTLRKTAKESEGLSQAFKGNLNAAGLASAGVIAAMGAMSAAAVTNAASYEQNRIAFESMLGSADRARSLLKQVSDFAQQTPFELPQVVEGSKRLLAYNIEAKRIIPTFRMLGDIAAGVGTDKLPQLITAFGQVQAKGKLMGTELLQFTEAGVGLLDALVKKANENGGMLVTTTKGTKLSADAQAKLNSQLAIAKQRLNEANASGKAKASTLMSLQAKIGEYEGKLAGASAGQQSFTSKVKVTREQMQDMISDGQVSAQQVEEALTGMTSKGGLFFEGMERQSKSFNGLMSNIRDQFGKMIRAAAGIDDQGDIREGSLLDVLKGGAERLLPILNEATPKVIAFFDALTRNQPALIAIAGAIGGLLVLAIGAAVVAWGPIIAIMATAAVVGAAVAVGIAGLIKMYNDFSPIVRARIDEVKAKMDELWAKVSAVVESARQAIARLPEALRSALNLMWEAVKNFNPILKIGLELPDIAGAIKSALSGAKSSGVTGRYASGTDYAPGGMALVGERGPELVYLPRGSQVKDTRETQGIMGGGGPALHIDQVIVRSQSDIDSLSHRFAFASKTRGDL